MSDVEEDATATALSQCFVKLADGRRRCVHCDTKPYGKNTSVDNLKHHMHKKHSGIARRLNIQLPSTMRRGASSDSPALTMMQAKIMDDDDVICMDEKHDDLPPGPSSSAARASSSSSLTNKRVAMAPPPQKRLKQTVITTYDRMRQSATAAAIDAQVDYFLYRGVAFRAAEDPYLLNWLRIFKDGDGTIATPRRMQTLAEDRMQLVKDTVTARLRACHGVAVGIDGWTNVRHDKVINLCPVGRGIAYYWASVVMKRDSGADAQYPGIAAKLDEMLSAGVPVVAIVTDNEPVNMAVYERLRIKFPFLLHIPCAAHTLQLCVRKVMKLPIICACVDQLLAMLVAFKHSKELRIALKEQQLLLHPSRPVLQLITVVATRWNSVLFAAERILRLEDSIKPFVPKIITQLSKEKKRAQYAGFAFCEGTFWHPLRTLVGFLAPYRVATNIVQSDSACLAEVHQSFATLMSNASDLAIPHPLVTIRDEVMGIIRNQWDTHVNKNLVISCALLGMEASYSSFPEEERSSATSWLIKWAPTFLIVSPVTAYDTEDEIRGQLLVQISQFHRRDGRFTELESRRTLMRQTAAAQHKHLSMRDVWGLYLEDARELALTATALLELTCSEAAVERSFSRQGLIHSKQRNRLLDDSVHLQMSFAFNTRALETAHRRHSADFEELTEEVAEAEAMAMSRGTALLSQYCSSEEILPQDDRSDPESDEEKAEPGPAPAQLQVKEISSSDEEDSDEEEDAEPPADDKPMAMRVRDFIAAYCAQHKMQKTHRWTPVREQILQGEIIAAGLNIMVEDMKKMINSHFGP
jgi:hypothetical protein